MTNYSQQYFGKDLTQLKFDDISDFFVVAKEESDKIEFKAFHPKYGNFKQNLDGVNRGICAFLNSNGGILIWGAPLGQTIDGKEIFQGDLSPVKELMEKDAIISKISDSITPLPVNINVNILSDNDNHLYIFEIQQSNYSPHQFKNTYYARLDGQTKPAPHYLIEALFRKISYPNIEGFLDLERYGVMPNGRSFLDISIIIINFSELQNELNLNYRVICGQAIFLGSTNPNTSRLYSMEGHQYLNSNNIDILHFGAPEKTTQRLIFDMESVRLDYNNQMDLILYFGGKKSPLKFSEYKLNFNLNSIREKYPVELFASIKENQLASQKQAELGTTRENLLSTILHRK